MKIATEKKSVEIMIKLYCRKKHCSQKGVLCEECDELLRYAEAKLSKCRYGDEKPFCSNCTTHCYSKNMQEKIKIVMRYAGARMLFRHPILAFLHLISTRK